MGYNITTSNNKYSANNANETTYSADNVTEGGYAVADAGGPAESNWILRDGTWRDEGVWIDTETWKDS